MPNLSIKNVPAELVGKLLERARANHRSLQGDLLALVSQATSEPSAAVDLDYELVSVALRKARAGMAEVARQALIDLAAGKALA